MAQKAKATSTTSDDPWWFLNPEIGRLAKPELVFVTQWTWHEKAAKEFLWDGAGGGRIRWYAEIEIFENNPVFKTCAGLLTFNTAVNQGLWHHNYFTMDWEASRGIYAGPAILLVQNPECPEQSSVFYDGRASVRIVARLMRFHHGDAKRELCRRGLIPAAKSHAPDSGCGSRGIQRHPCTNVSQAVPAPGAPDRRAAPLRHRARHDRAAAAG